MATVSEKNFTLPGYKVIRELGIGGQARVYLAEQESFQRKVAIKVLLPSAAEDPAFTARFLREARIVANLTHPHIIPVYDFGQSEETFYMVMEHVSGGGLSQWIKAGIAIEEALRIASQLAQALHFAHERGVVHRDVKPDNVMFREDGSVVLMDFGIARGQDPDSQVTKVGQVLGTPTYMSPEQLQGRKVDGRSDIYSLGIMFYQMLAKKVPYEGDDFMALAMMHTSHPIPKLPSQFSKYQKIFEKMVAKEPAKRFQSGMELSKLFQNILSGKEDPLRVSSSAAESLKAAAKFAIEEEEKKSGRPGRPKIAREHMRFLQDLQPALDIGWQRKLTRIFQKLEPEKKKYVYQNLLNPKGVYIDKESKSFVFQGIGSVNEIQGVLNNRSLQVVAEKILKIEQSLRITQDVGIFSDLVESSLSLIDEFDCQDSLPLHKQKTLLRTCFLHDLVLIVQGANFKIPESRRQLTAESVKAYIVQVFIRQQIMGYRFRTEHVNNLEADDHPFVSQVIAPQVRIRQCTVVRTDNDLFLIGPARDISQNPYSIRRFINEDSAMGGNIVYFNAVVVPLTELDSKEVQKKIAWSISRIITLQKQLSPGVAEVVENMEQAHKNVLLPMLLKPIEADGTRLETAIAGLLREYERELTLLILVELTRTIKEQAKTPDDFEYLFSQGRSLLVELAADARDFGTQASTSWSQAAEELDLKMISYLRLFDKRKESIIDENSPSESEYGEEHEEEMDPLLDPRMPLKEFKNVVDEYAPVLGELQEKLAEVIRKESERKSPALSWLQRIFGFGSKRVTVDMVQNEIDSTKQRCLISFVKIAKRYPKVTVYLEFEDLVEVEETKRHYALPSGLAGLARLPKLIMLPEEKDLLDLKAIEKILSEDILKQIPKKAGDLRR